MTKQQIELLEFMYGKTITFDDIRVFFRLSEENFKKQRYCLLSDEVFKCLQQLPFEPRTLDLLKHPVCLSNYGMEIVEAAREARKNKRVKEIRGWATAIIALLALLLSVASLMWQTYTWKAEQSEKSELTESKSTVGATTAAGVRASNQ